jgi:hypothetical protein
LNALGSQVELGGLADTGAVSLSVSGNKFSLIFPDNITLADVSLINDAEVNVASDGGGSIAINARHIDILGRSGLRAGIKPLSQRGGTEGTWIAIETYGKAKKSWLNKFLELPNGIPSGFASGTRSGCRRQTRRVSAWATSNRLVLAQRQVDKKSNEITAIPELIKVLEIAGCIITIDAMGCQREIVKTIIQKGGDYIIALKENQRSLYENVENLFKQAIQAGFKGFNVRRCIFVG